jgi:hypothetical protein
MARPNPQDLLREFAGLNRRRKSEGISPLELQRWSDLQQQLARAFPARAPLSTGGLVRVRVEFHAEQELREAIMVNVRPIGLFVHTPFAPEAGYVFALRVFVKETGESYDGEVKVISNNVGPDFSTASLGMGLRFTKAESTLRTALDRIYTG